jgi:hypothetical protein
MEKKTGIQQIEKISTYCFIDRYDNYVWIRHTTLGIQLTDAEELNDKVKIFKEVVRDKPETNQETMQQEVKAFYSIFCEQNP